MTLSFRRPEGPAEAVFPTREVAQLICIPRRSVSVCLIGCWPFENFYLFCCVCVSAVVHTFTAGMWRSEGNFMESVLSFLHVNPRDPAQMIRFGRCLYLVSHSDSPIASSFMVLNPWALLPALRLASHSFSLLLWPAVARQGPVFLMPVSPSLRKQGHALTFSSCLLGLI